MNCRKKSRFSSLIALTFLLLPAFVHAQTTSVIFERASIRIDPIPTAQSSDPKSPVEARAGVTYSVEVRGQDALRLEYIHTLNTLTDATGVMITFLAPTLIGLPALRDYTAIDAIFIGGDGSILQIAPGVVLAELEVEVMAKEPVKAFLFLKAGQVAAHQLRPHDMIVGPMFNSGPSVMQ